MKKFSDLGIEHEYNGLEGKKTDINAIVNTNIVVEKFLIKDSTIKQGEKCLHLQLLSDGERKVLFTGSKVLMGMIQKVSADDFPFTTKIIIENKAPKFT